MISKIPEAWPALLNREQLCAYLNLPEETITRVLQLVPLDFGQGMLRWNRLQVDEVVQALRSRPPPLSSADRRKIETAQRKAAGISDEMHFIAEFHATRLRYDIRRIKKSKPTTDEGSQNQNYKPDIAINELFIGLAWGRAAVLVYRGGIRYLPTFEELEWELAEKRGDPFERVSQGAEALRRALGVARISIEEGLASDIFPASKRRSNHSKSARPTKSGRRSPN